MKPKRCCFCGKELGQWGNSPYPACTKSGAQCCDECNMNIVIPLRILRATMKGDSDEEI